jgi:hypothetical protein
MAAKKSLNNPNKPATKTTSTKSPARYGGEVTKMTGDGKAVSYTNAKGKKENIAGGAANSTYLAKNGQARKDGKKLVKSGIAANTNTVASSMTKKGNKVQANKLSRELNKPEKKGK